MKCKTCPRCKGKGFVIINRSLTCGNGERHRYSRRDGTRSDTCLYCGMLRDSVKETKQ